MQDRPIDVKPTVLEGELSVIRNEQVKLFHILQIYSQISNFGSICIKLLWYFQGISEDHPSKAVAAEGLNNDAFNPSDEVVLIHSFFLSFFSFNPSVQAPFIGYW